MKKSILFILFGAVALGSCKKIVEVKDLDKEVDLYFSYAYNGSSLAAWNNNDSITLLKDFDKRDFKHIDSITLNISLIAKPGDTAFVRLYNITDEVEIANSQMAIPGRNVSDYIEYHSNNILANLPDKRVTLAVQMRSSRQNGAVAGYGPRLKLRRN
jgi:hypothetical protein